MATKERRLLIDLLRLHLQESICRDELPVLADDKVDWVAAISEANRERIAPALLTALRRHNDEALLPDDVRQYLELLLEKNGERNARIRQQCLAVGEHLHRAGITAVLLKGAAWLFDDDNDAAADRMMGDIDLLVEPGRIDEATALLERCGYIRDAAPTELDHFHQPTLMPAEGEAPLELHHDLSHWPARAPVPEILRDARAVAPGLALPSPAHRLVHNILHAQLENGDWLGGVVSLRDTLDCARIAAGKAEEIDWSRLRALARERRYLTHLSGGLHVAAGFFGMPLRKDFEGDWRGRAHLLRCRWNEKLATLGAAQRAAGTIGRALAWERDAYGLRRKGQRGAGLLMGVMQCRAQRLTERLRGKR